MRKIGSRRQIQDQNQELQAINQDMGKRFTHLLTVLAAITSDARRCHWWTPWRWLALRRRLIAATAAWNVSTVFGMKEAQPPK